MKSNTKALTKLLKILSGEGPFAHIVHPRPDGDGLGSAMAMHLYLKARKKKSAVYTPDTLPRYVRDLPRASEIRKHLPKPAQARVVLAYDSGDSRRMKKVYDCLNEAEEIVNIDHHVTNDRYGTLNIVDEKASSTGEVVYALLKKLGSKISTSMAIWLYLAIMSDTGSFRYSNTTADTLRVAADLVDLGADPHDLYRKVYEEIDPGRLRFTQEVLSHMKRERGGKLVYAEIPYATFKKYHQEKEDTQDLLDAMRSLKKADVVVLFKEYKHETRVSLRSEQTDVARIAKCLGGGGHKRAAGAELSGGLQSAKRKVLSLLRKEL